MREARYERLLALGFAAISLFASTAVAQMIVTPEQPMQLPRPEAALTASGKYIVTFVPGTNRSQRAQIARDVGVTVRFNYKTLDAIAIRVPNQNALNALMKRREVVSIVPDHPFQLDVKPETPPAPTGLEPTNVAYNSITLGWQQGVNSNEEGFRVERCMGDSCGTFSPIGTTGANITTFTDNTVAAEQTYRYRVIAFITGGPPSLQKDSEPATSTPIITPAKPPQPPPPSGATGYTGQLIPAGIQRVGVPVAGSDGEGIGVAVLDTGLDFNQPDLAPALDDPGTTSFSAFTGSSGQDDNGHGTHVAGIIAALDNNIGVLGVASKATLYAVKVADAAGNGEDSHLIAGLDWVAQVHSTVTPPIRVVNMSLGRPIETGDFGGPLHQAVQQLYNQGVVVVASAGNDPTIETTEHVPSGFPEVLAVAGTVTEPGGDDALCAGYFPYKVKKDTAAYFTSDGAFNELSGTGVTISAPSEHRMDPFSETSFFGSCLGIALHGVRSTTLILNGDSSDPNTVVTSRQIPAPAMGCPCEAVGTSFAAPHVAGVVARIMQLGLVEATGSLEVEGIRNWIRDNADRRGSNPDPGGLSPAPLDQPYGYYSFDGEREGIVQAPYPAP